MYFKKPRHVYMFTIQYCDIYTLEVAFVVEIQVATI